MERMLLKLNTFSREDSDMWQICFKEYDGGGMLVGLVSCRTECVKRQWRRIDTFLSACPERMVREVQFCRGGKNFPSIVSNGHTRGWHAPITAMMPLFDYMKRISE